MFTPNLPEAAILLGDETPADEGGMENTARRLWNLAGCGPTVYLKGGHLSGDRMVDLVFDGKEVRRYESSRVKTENTHGVGGVFRCARLSARRYSGCGSPVSGKRTRSGQPFLAEVREIFSEFLDKVKKIPHNSSSHGGLAQLVRAEES